MEDMYRRVPLVVSNSCESLQLQRDHNKCANEAFVVIIAKLQDIAKQLDEIAARVGAL